MKHLDTRLLNQARAVKLSPSKYDLTNEQIILARHLANEGKWLPEIMEAIGWGDRGKRMEYCRKILKERYRIMPHSRAYAVHRGISPITDVTHCPTNPKPWRPRRVTP